MKVQLHELAAAIAARPEEPLEVVDEAGAPLGSFIPGDHAAALVAAGFKAGIGDACDNAVAVLHRRLFPVLEAVIVMRGHQRDWFGGDKSREKLNEARKAEREVDRLLRELDAPGPARCGKVVNGDKRCCLPAGHEDWCTWTKQGGLF